jgi:hypothetical protein
MLTSTTRHIAPPARSRRPTSLPCDPRCSRGDPSPPCGPPLAFPSRRTAGRLDRLEVPVVDSARAYESFDLGDGLGFERRVEPPYWPPCEAAGRRAPFAKFSVDLHASQA